MPVVRTYKEALALPRVDVPHCIDSVGVRSSLGDLNVGEFSRREHERSEATIHIIMSHRS